MPKAGGRSYEDSEMVFIANPKQAITYMRQPNVHLYDCFINSSGDRLIFVFSKLETAQLYERWKNYELE